MHFSAIHFSDLDNVKLFIDGEVFNTTERNPEILDDWPLHITKEKVLIISKISFSILYIVLYVKPKYL